MAMSKRCCAMWTVSDTSSKAFSGDPMAIQTEAIPAKNAASRRAEISLGKAP